jgi:outer membrane receptor protein involved in Fe transport
VDGAPQLVERNLDIGQGQWLTGGFQVSRRLAGRHRVTLGVERRQHLEERMLNYYEGESPLLDVSRRSSTSAAYVQDEWRLWPALLVNAGLRYDQYAAFDDPIKPRGALIFQPAARTAVKLLYGEAFRAPNVFETDYAYPGSYLPNARLAPEETRTVEALVEHYAGRRARLAASWFHYTVSDLIDQRFDEALGASRYDNVAAVAATGYEAEAELKWPGGAQVLASYTHSRARNTITTERLTNAPAHVVQVRATPPCWAGTCVALDLHALSARWTPRGTEVGAYVVPNVTVSRQSRGRGLGFAFTVANLTDTAYADPVSTDFEQAAVVQDGRTARLRLSWTF